MRIAAIRVTAALILLLPVTLLGSAAAQSPGKTPRVGYLSPGSGSDPARLRRFEAFRQGLRELGYAEGQNIVLEPRWGQYAEYPALAVELIRSKAEVIVAVGGAATQAAQQATRTIPIVMSAVNDPIGSRIVPSLAHPGGNVTGMSLMAPDIVGKQLEVLRDVVPKLSRVALLSNPDNPASVVQVREAEAAARVLGMRLQTLKARVPQEIDSAFAAMIRERAGAIVVLADGILMNQRSQIISLAAERRLPALYPVREYVEAGGLMVYSPNVLDLERRAAIFVDKILKGAKPADLPVEQPTRFELVINMKTAKALRLTIPPSLVQRADQVIE